MADLQHLVSFVQHRRARQLLGRGAQPGPDAGRRQQERGAARGRSRRAAVPSQHAAPGADRRRRALPAQVTRPLASLQGALSPASRDARRRARGHAEGQHGPGASAATSSCRCSASSSRAIRPSCPTGTSTTAQVDLVGEGFDAAIGGGFELTPGVVARELAPVHIVAVASPAYLAGRPLPRHPDDFAELRRHHAPLVADRPRAAVDAAPAPRRRPARAVPAAADLQRPRGDRAGARGWAWASRCVPMPFAFAHIASRRARAPAARLVQRCRPAVALLPEPAPAAGQDAASSSTSSSSAFARRLRAAGRRALKPARRGAAPSPAHPPSPSPSPLTDSPSGWNMPHFSQDTGCRPSIPIPIPIPCRSPRLPCSNCCASSACCRSCRRPSSTCRRTDIDRAIEDSLARIVAALDIDRSTLTRVFPLTGQHAR